VVDTPRTQAELLALFADNTTGNIDAQDARDLIVSGPIGTDITVNSPPGPQGEQGEEGQQGPPGIAGATGAQGATGNNGSDGATGAQGPTGVPLFLLGEQGEPGEFQPGPMGATGAQGSTGNTGAEGPVGPPVFLLGEQGEPGEYQPGPMGPQGVTGATGNTGAQGPAGPALEFIFPLDENEPFPFMPPTKNLISAVTTPAVPLSNTALVNNTGVNVTVFIKAGTLTVITLGGVATGIAAAAPASTCHVIPLAAGQTIAITYTVAPTWVWIGTL
jgi:hypothetical protein